MDDPITKAYIWRIIVLIVGTLYMFMGYKLFEKGLSNGETEASAKHGDTSISFKKLAPGSFFALLGAVIIIFIVTDEFNYSSSPDGIDFSEEKQEENFDIDADE